MQEGSESPKNCKSVLSLSSEQWLTNLHIGEDSIKARSTEVVHCPYHFCDKDGVRGSQERSRVEAELVQLKSEVKPASAVHCVYRD
jgi:hypothetical protein